MALSLESLRNLGLTSIFGRRLTLDKDDFLVGPKDLRNAVEDISTTAATSAINYGVTRVLTSGSSQNGQYTLQAPVTGTRKILSLTSTSTGTQQFQMGTGISVLTSSDGSTSAVVNLLGRGAVADLIALSSAVWQCVSVTGSSASPLVSFTTST